MSYSKKCSLHPNVLISTLVQLYENIVGKKNHSPCQLYTTPYCFLVEYVTKQHRAKAEVTCHTAFSTD